MSTRIDTRPTSLLELAAADGAARSPSPPALSPSRAADFKLCPLLYRLRAIDRIAEEPSQAQVRGTVVHAALENLFDLPAPLRTLDAATDLVDGAWEAICVQDPQLRDLVPAESVEEFLADAHRLIDAYFRMENPQGFDAAECEMRIELDLDGVRLRGFIDRLDVAPTGEIRVVDYKTGRSPGPAFEAKALFQMKFYALAILRIRGEVPARLQLMYLSDGQQLRYTPDREELERFAKTLTAIWSAIEAAGRSGEFPPKRSSMCSFCDHKSSCPEFGGTPPPYPGWPTTAPDSPATK